MALAIRVCVDVHHVAVLSKAIDEGTEARCVVKDGAPLLEGEVGRDRHASFFVPAADDVKQQVRK